MYGKIRFDGVYSAWDGAMFRHLRFFPSGNVAFLLVDQNAHECIKGLHEDFCRECGGTFEVEGDRVKFVVTEIVKDLDETVVVEYDGFVFENRLELKIYSRTTGNASQKTFRFVLVADRWASTKDRVAWLEKISGCTLPKEVVEHFVRHEPLDESSLEFVTPDDVYPVRGSYCLNDNEDDEQIDDQYCSIYDVMPPGLLPIANDWANRKYCVVLAGADSGAVVLWDHEQDDGGSHSLHLLANSLQEFFNKLTPNPESDD